MQITRQVEYAVRTVLYLARQTPGACVATAQIAKEQGIPNSFLAKIVLQLSAVGVLHTSRGAKGGVKLAKSAEDISLLEIVEAIDGPIELNECVLHADRCDHSPDCPVRQTWCEARSEFAKRLGRANFALLAANGHEARQP